MNYSFYLPFILILCIRTCQSVSTESTGIQPLESFDSTIVYKIKAGDHYCQQTHLKYITKTTLAFTATFNESAVYQTKDPAKQEDVNKLYGISDCNDQHQINSARFGWNWHNDALYIYAYHYTNGVLQFHPMGVALLNKSYRYQILIEENHYRFNFNGIEYSVARGCSDIIQPNRYQLYPYFGGTEVAPHDISIEIHEL